MERVKGIEPSSEAWEAPALPLSYTRAPRMISDPRPPASGLRRRSRSLRAVRPCRRRIDRDGAHIRRQADFEDLEIVRGGDFVVVHTTRDEARVACLEPAAAAILELQLDPALERVDELSLADVVMPAGRLGHSGNGRCYLRPHPPVRRLGDAEIAVLEE